MVFDIVGGLLSIASIVCFIIILVKMFQHGETTVGILCIVGICLCGLGPLVAFIYGWVKSSEWQVRPVMIVWTICVLVNLILGFVHTPSWVVEMQNMRR